MDALEIAEHIMTQLHKNEPTPYAFYKSRFVSLHTPVECFFLRAEMIMKLQLQNGKSLPTIRDWALSEIEPLWENLGEPEGDCKSIWGDEWRNRVGVFAVCVCILLKLKVIEDDMANGFGYR